MKLILVFFSLIISASYSYGLERAFHKFSDLSDKAQSEYEKAYRAQFKITVHKGSRCTGTFISNEGHGITAAHCVESCMPIPTLEEIKKWPVDVVLKDGKMSRHAVSAYPWTYPKKCTAFIDGVEKEIEILSGPKGMLSNKVPFDIVRKFRQYLNLTSPETKAYKNLWSEAFRDDWGFGADFAIFKVLKTSKTDCLQVSEKENFSGGHYVLSYPGKTSASDKKINHSLYLSTGVVYQGDYFNGGFMVLKDEEHRYLNSSIEAYPGSSGASLVSLFDDEISGVLSMTAGGLGPNGEEQGVSARFISAKKIREVAKDVLFDVTCSN